MSALLLPRTEPPPVAPATEAAIREGLRLMDGVILVIAKGGVLRTAIVDKARDDAALRL